jgi:NTP pyrophosphatase (non-canonical NTP hydrolase)
MESHYLPVAMESPELLRLFPMPAAQRVAVGDNRRNRQRSQKRQLKPTAPSTPSLFAFEFHSAFSLPMSTAPTISLQEGLVDLRMALIEEEVEELREASRGRDLVAIADALGDCVYVLYGTALTYGIDLDAVLAEIHRSNMSKLGPEGKPLLRPDGKVIKGPFYTPPDLTNIVGHDHQRLDLSPSEVSSTGRNIHPLMF